MKAFINIIDNKVMLSKLPKPEITDPEFWMGLTDIPHDPLDYPTYNEAMQEFNDSIIGEAQNAEIMLNQYAPDYNICVHSGNIDYGDYTYDFTKPGLSCHIEGLIITGLINE